MITIKGKQYSTIFFDWFNTLYSPGTKNLFPWVEPYFKTSGALTQNYLITTASNGTQRFSTIRRLGAEDFFDEIHLSIGNKEKVFKDIIEVNNFDIKEILVVGDNYGNELKVAKALGLDAMHVDHFALIAQKLISVSSK